MVEIKAPQFPESISDGTIITWYKSEGEAVKRDEVVVDIETDKVVLEVLAPTDGVIKSILKQEGDVVESIEVLAHLSAGKVNTAQQGTATVQNTAVNQGASEVESESEAKELSPSVRKLVLEHGLDSKSISGTGRGGRITKEDVNQYLAAQSSQPKAASVAAKGHSEAANQTNQSASKVSIDPSSPVLGREQKRVPMTRLRARIAERLLAAKQDTAMLTTFNEVNMQPVMTMRSNYKDSFEKAHGVRLGFMSFFVKASVEALKHFPMVNASIDGNDIVYHGFYDVGVAVSTERGLVVPIIRDADQKGFAEIEQQIVDYGKKASSGKLTIEDMSGGTFTISNGGVFGSLLSTPIVNPPQTAILGMHKIQQRPMAVNGQVVIQPIMYLALSYDHRMIDGKEAVQFLVNIKEVIEDPARLLLEI